MREQHAAEVQEQEKFNKELRRRKAAAEAEDRRIRLERRKQRKEKQRGKRQPIPADKELLDLMREISAGEDGAAVAPRTGRAQLTRRASEKQKQKQKQKARGLCC